MSETKRCAHTHRRARVADVRCTSNLRGTRCEGVGGDLNGLVWRGLAEFWAGSCPTPICRLRTLNDATGIGVKAGRDRGARKFGVVGACAAAGGIQVTTRLRSARCKAQTRWGRMSELE